MSEAGDLLLEIALRHKRAWDAEDAEAVVNAENEALIVCEVHDFPINVARLLLASYWPSGEG